MDLGHPRRDDFARICANSAGIFSMRAVADFRRSGSGANSRAIRL
jgi:hypothetical protein